MSVQPRSTVYKGIQMRSRLEADFARWLDSKQGLPVFHAPWEYEPQCFAGPAGQYLPDFRIGPGVYVEVKPSGFRSEQIDPTLRRMEIIRESEPDAILVLVIWGYGAQQPPFWFINFGTDLGLGCGWFLYDDQDGSAHWPGVGVAKAETAGGR